MRSFRGIRHHTQHYQATSVVREAWETCVGGRLVDYHERHHEPGLVGGVLGFERGDGFGFEVSLYVVSTEAVVLPHTLVLVLLT
jgi:hypothetical protein